jgi:hypothetical protein
MPHLESTSTFAAVTSMPTVEHCAIRRTKLIPVFCSGEAKLRGELSFICELTTRWRTNTLLPRGLETPHIAVPTSEETLVGFLCP